MKKILVCLIIPICALICSGCVEDSKYPSGQFGCDAYLTSLHKIANTPQDLIETHLATGVINGIDENEKYYVVIINPALWSQASAEQRILIRCSVTETAYAKGKIGGIIDPIRNERLY